MPPSDAGLRARRGLLLLVAGAALTAVLAGLARIGWPTAWGVARATEHAPLFVAGVFVTLIAVERAVALARPWSWSAPVLGALGAVLLVAGLPGAPWLALGAAVALSAVNGAIVRRQAAPFTALMLGGSAVLVAGDAAWAAGRPVFTVVPCWLAFFVLTIAAERLELSRLAPTPRWATRLFVVLAVVLGAAACAAAWPVAGAVRVMGGATALVALWQLRFDVARRTLRRPGLPRYAAAGVLLGAGWLLLAGVVLALVPVPPAGPVYDAVLHAVFVGFVLSMVFAHAPIVLPAVARVALPFHPALWAPLVVLHAGLVARVVGDLAGDFAWRRAGGLANAAALGLFVVAVLAARTAGARRPAVRPRVGAPAG